MVNSPWLCVGSSELLDVLIISEYQTAMWFRHEIKYIVNSLLLIIGALKLAGIPAFI